MSVTISDAAGTTAGSDAQNTETRNPDTHTTAMFARTDPDATLAAQRVVNDAGLQMGPFTNPAGHAGTYTGSWCVSNVTFVYEHMYVSVW